MTVIEVARDDRERSSSPWGLGAVLAPRAPPGDHPHFSRGRWARRAALSWVQGDAPGSTAAKGDSSGTAIHDCPEHFTVQRERLQGQFPFRPGSWDSGRGSSPNTISWSYQYVTTSAMGEELGEEFSSPLENVGEDANSPSPKFNQGTFFCEINSDTSC